MALLLAYAAPAEGRAFAQHYEGSVVETGVGKAAAATSLTAAIVERAPSAVLLFGVCGAYPSRHLPPGIAGCEVGEVCVVGSERFGDEGVQTEEGFLDLDRLGLGSIEPLVATPGLVEELARSTGARVVAGSTVSTCSGNEALSRARTAAAAVQIETMEGAAAAYVCQRFQLPFAQLRCVSNYTGDRARADWQLERAVSNLSAALRAHLELSPSANRS